MDTGPVTSWLNASWVLGVDVDTLRDPSPYWSLDLKIAQGMTNVIRNMAKQYPLSKGEGLKAAAVGHAWNLENELTATNEEYSLSNRLVTGRQMLAMVIRRFMSNDNSDIGYGLDHRARASSTATRTWRVSSHARSTSRRALQCVISCRRMGYRDILYRKSKDSDALKFPMHEYEKKAASERTTPT